MVACVAPVRHLPKSPDSFALCFFFSESYFERALDRSVGGVGAKCLSLLSTGNVVSSTGLDLMQVSGFTVVAERLNMLRYMSHFRAVHRGQFFTTMKTTTVRAAKPHMLLVRQLS